MTDLWTNALFSGVRGGDPIVAGIPVRPQKEGDSALLSGTEMQYKKSSVITSFPARDAQGMTLGEFLDSAINLGVQLAQQQAKRLIESITEPSPHAVPVNWQHPLNFRQIIDTWRQMEINFGPDGKPIWPTVFLSDTDGKEFAENFPKWLQDPEFAAQMTELVALKRKEFDEREARRRLVD